jgi:hypothetical protein
LRHSVVRWRRCKAGLSKQVGSLELSPPFSLEVRPFAGGFSCGDLHSVSIVIEPFDQTVDHPCEALPLEPYLRKGSTSAHSSRVLKCKVMSSERISAPYYAIDNISRDSVFLSAFDRSIYFEVQEAGCPAGHA